MNVNTPLIFIHGLLGSSQGFKATMLRGLFSDMLIPDFNGSLEERMAQLDSILAGQSGWTIIGSSMGGLMATLFTCQHPQQVQELVLLAPALTWPDLADHPPAPVSVPATVYHGSKDTVVPVEPVRALCERIFVHLTFHVVDDEHKLHKTTQAIDWPSLIK